MSKSRRAQPPAMPTLRTPQEIMAELEQAEQALRGAQRAAILADEEARVASTLVARLEERVDTLRWSLQGKPAPVPAVPPKAESQPAPAITSHSLPIADSVELALRNVDPKTIALVAIPQGYYRLPDSPDGGEWIPKHPELVLPYRVHMDLDGGKHVPKEYLSDWELVVPRAQPGPPTQPAPADSADAHA